MAPSSPIGPTSVQCTDQACGESDLLRLHDVGGGVLIVFWRWLWRRWPILPDDGRPLRPHFKSGLHHGRSGPGPAGYSPADAGAACLSSVVSAISRLGRRRKKAALSVLGWLGTFNVAAGAGTGAAGWGREHSSGCVINPESR